MALGNLTNQTVVNDGGGGQKKTVEDVVDYNELPEAEVEIIPEEEVKEDDDGGWFYQEPAPDTNDTTDYDWSDYNSGGSNYAAPEYYGNAYAETLNDENDYYNTTPREQKVETPVIPSNFEEAVVTEINPGQTAQAEQQAQNNALVQSLYSRIAENDNNISGRLPMVPAGVDTSELPYYAQQTMERAIEPNSAQNTGGPRRENQTSVWDQIMNLGVTPAYGESEGPSTGAPVTGTQKVLGTYPSGTMDYLQQNNLTTEWLNTPEGQEYLQQQGAPQQLANNVDLDQYNRAIEVLNRQGIYGEEAERQALGLVSDANAMANMGRNIGNAVSTGARSVAEALQDPEWLQEMTGGKSLAGLYGEKMLLDYNPALLPIWLSGNKPSQVVPQAVEEYGVPAAKGLSQLLELGGEAFRSGFDTVSDKFGQGVDLVGQGLGTANSYARKGLDAVTENVLLPGIGNVVDAATESDSGTQQVQAIKQARQEYRDSANNADKMRAEQRAMNQSNGNQNGSAGTTPSAVQSTSQIPGYNADGTPNSALQSMLNETTPFNQRPTEIPGYNADGTPNGALQAILNKEGFNIVDGYDITQFKDTAPDIYETLRRQQSEGYLSMFDEGFGTAGRAGRFQGITDFEGKSYEKFLASNTARAVGNGEMYVMDPRDNSLNKVKNIDIEWIDASSEEYKKALDDFIEDNKTISDMIKAGVITKEDVMRHFFKELKGSDVTEKEEKEESYSKGGGGGKSSSSRSSGGGGGGYSYGGSSQNNQAVTQEQKNNRINNIMKNWTF